MIAASPLYLTPDWPAPPGVRALSTVRTGGVSVAPYQSLNLGQRTGDSEHALIENQRRLMEAARLPASPQWLVQVHGTAVVDLDRPRASVDEADAAVTRRTGNVCAIQTADCLPVLFAAADGSAVGAAHAGWRGLAGGVLQATLQRLQDIVRDRAQIIVWLGPAISAAHFEVGDEVRAAFVEADTDAEIAFVENARGRWQCDLYTLARRILSRAGVADIYGGEHCSYAETSRFFSHRRDAGRSGGTGRMATLIWREAVAL